MPRLLPLVDGRAHAAKRHLMRIKKRTEQTNKKKLMVRKTNAIWSSVCVDADVGRGVE